ncbi:MAG: L,D-transpeptidase [Parvularcula sp.]|nr:L,D-transpeptidase [Parvularcula sp.]
MLLTVVVACASLAACSRAPISTPDPVAAIDRNEAAALIAAVEGLEAAGVPKGHFDMAPLHAAIAAGEPALIRTRAEALFDEAAADISSGLTPPAARPGWRMNVKEPDEDAFADLKTRAFDTGDFAQAFASLAPKHEQYARLKSALNAENLSAEEKARLRLNMDRWRWMPDDLGADYILVNVPAFELTLVRDGQPAARRRVVTGTPKLPTPQMNAMVTGVIFNPTWFVPQSIVRESIGALMKNDPARAERLGYYADTDGNVRQRPGPANALGQMKLVMPNPYSVFLHDTPSKDAFDRETRALSHGCIRVQDALGFARTLLGDAISDEDFKEIVAKRQTAEIDLATPLPVYVAYFTAVADAAGAVEFYPDIYGLDAALLAQFGGAATDPDPIKTLIEETCPESADEVALRDTL